MFKATLKSIGGHKGRVVATALAVIFSIAFLSGTLIFISSVNRAFNDLFATVFENTDTVVRSTDSIEAGFGFEIRNRIPESVLAEVAAVDGVAVAEGFVQGTATVVDSDGEPIGNPGQGPPTFGFSWGDDPELSQFTLNEGSRAPTADNEVVLDQNTAEIGGFSVGDSVQILTASGSNQFELVGIARFGTSNSLGGATTALFELGRAQELLGAGDNLDGISVRAVEGIDEQTITDRLNAELGTGLEAISGSEATEEQQDAIAEGLSFFNIFLIVFAVIALIVSFFVILNTFSILIAQRTREFALLRAIGASSRQILSSVFVEAIVIGLIGSLLGVVLGVGLSILLRGMLAAFGIDLPSGGLIVWESMPTTVIVSLVVGTLVTLVSSLFPAIRAARIAPVEAMRQSAAEPYARNRTRFALGMVVEVLGFALIMYGLLAPEILAAGIGAVVMFIGVFVLGPSIARPASRLIGAPLAAGRGTIGAMARDNSMRNPKRTAWTAAALTIGVALVAGVTVLASSLARSIEGTVGEQFSGDFVLDSGAFIGGGFSTNLTADLEALDQIDVATGLKYGATDGAFYTALDPATAFDILDIQLIEGSPEELTDEAIFLHESRAEDLGVGYGDMVPFTLSNSQEVDLRVAGIYTEQIVVGDQIISTGLHASSGVEQLDIRTYATLADGVSFDEARQVITDKAAPYPNAELQDREEYIESQSEGLNQLLGLIYGMLGMAIIIAAFGIANTLRLSTIERTREIGLLRAVGMTRGQVRALIRWESVITAIFGALLGVLLGLLFGYVIIYALRDQGTVSFNVPILALIILVVLAAIVGVISSIVPSIRASRLNILDAIATD